jgi:hypothetical protein
LIGQTIETLINEEALLFAKYLREEKKEWLPRVGITKQAARATLEPVKAVCL